LLSSFGALMSANQPDNPHVGDDSLDQLLREARWPDAGPGTVSRLTQQWEGAWKARQRRALLLRRAAALAIAATLLAAVTLGWLGLRPREKVAGEKMRFESAPSPVEQRSTPGSDKADARPNRDPVIAKNAQPTKPSPSGRNRSQSLPTPITDRANDNTSQPTASQSAAPDEVVSWRPPNALELLVLESHDREREPANPSPPVARRAPRDKSPSTPAARMVATARRKSPATAKPVSPDQARVNAAVERLVSDQRADVAAVALELRKSRALSEQVLIEALDRGKTRERQAALRLLAEIAGPLSVPPLLRASQQPALHATALGTLVRLADPSVLGELARSERDAGLRQSLLAALLARGEPGSLDVFLSFVENEPTAEAALASAQTLKVPPMDLLFASLSSSLESRRIAAARVIGRIDGAVTTQRLIGMVEAGVNRHEACIALLSSRGPEAMQYVDAAARRDPALAAILSGARLFAPADNPPRS
jgi:hypothetical protein